jgi:hypothetical protein
MIGSAGIASLLANELNNTGCCGPETFARITSLIGDQRNYFSSQR